MAAEMPRGERMKLPRRVPPTEAAMASIGAAVLLTAFFPSNAPYRSAMAIVALLFLVLGALWFHVLPPNLFGKARPTAGATATVALVALLLSLTGGATSPYFPLYILAVIGSVFAVRPSSTLATGTGAVLAWILIVTFDAGELRPTPDNLDHASIRLAALGGATILGVLLTQSLRRSTDALTSLALTDPLTGLRNRGALVEDLGLLQALVERSDRTYSVLAVDIDHLKTINDTSGHESRDRAIVAVAQAIRAVIRASDLPFRTGGDEFLVLLPDTPRAGAPRVAAHSRGARRGRDSGDRERRHRGVDEGHERRGHPEQGGRGPRTARRRPAGTGS